MIWMTGFQPVVQLLLILTLRNDDYPPGADAFMEKVKKVRLAYVMMQESDIQEILG